MGRARGCICSLHERGAEGNKQRIQLSSLLWDFTDVSVIIALLGDFHIRRKAWMPAAFKRERKSETGEAGEEYKGRRRRGRRREHLIRFVGKINAARSKRIGKAPNARVAPLLFRSRG